MDIAELRCLLYVRYANFDLFLYSFKRGCVGMTLA